MSHFTVLVIGDDVEEQLAKYDEAIEVEKYEKGVISDNDKKSFIDFYSNYDENSHPILGLTPADVVLNKKLSFDELYAKYGEDWNNNEWEKNEKGEWIKYSTYNPNSKWDWYSVGGRWSGRLKLKEGVKAIAGNNIVTMGDVDWEGMRIKAEKDAQEYYEKVSNAFGGTIPQPEVKWDELWTNGKYKDWTKDYKRAFYFNQPALTKLESLKKEHSFLSYFDFDIEEFDIPKEQYIKQNSDISNFFFAVVKDGIWHEKAEMGYWAVTHNEKEFNEWSSEFKSLLENVSDDTILTLVDCHI